MQNALVNVLYGLLSGGGAKAAQMTAEGYLKAAIQSSVSSPLFNSPLAGSFTHISANGNSPSIKAGAGILMGVSINTKGASANVLTIYNSLAVSGAVIGVFDTTVQPVYIPLNLNFTIGLSASLATGTPADVTLIWR